MQLYNNIASAIFDVLLAPFGHGFAYFDLLLWPVLMGVGALVVYKYTSNQKAITAIKKQISMHLLEIRLFRDDLLQVLKSTVTIVAKNFIYIAHNLTPMVVMIVPMVALMVQLVAHYAYAPSQPGDVELLRVRLDPDSPVKASDISLTLPDGVRLDAPVVRSADGRVFWRLKAERAGDHVLKIDAGGRSIEKIWAVGGEPRKIPVKRLRGLEAVLYPGEEALPSSSPLLSIELATVVRPLPYLPDGEGGILLWILLVSLLAGVALKDAFGVTL